MKKQSTKIILLTTGIFLLAAGCGRQQAVSQSQPVNQPINKSVNQLIQEPSQSATTTAVKTGGQAPVHLNPDGSVASPDASQGGKNYPPQQEDPNLITVYQTVEGSNLNEPSYAAANGQWALGLLISSHTVTVKSYGSMGDFVTGIDGITPDSKHFWEFFVNGKSSNVGASSYHLKSGDKIEWKLSEIK